METLLIEHIVFWTLYGSLLVWRFLAGPIPSWISLEVKLFKKYPPLETKFLFLLLFLMVAISPALYLPFSDCLWDWARSVIELHYGTVFGKIFWPRILQCNLCVVIKISDSVSKTSHCAIRNNAYPSSLTHKVVSLIKSKWPHFF